MPNLSSYREGQFTIRLEDDRLDGYFANDNQGVVLDGDVRPSAAFALWVRSIVPDNQPLIVYDESYSFQLALTPGRAIEDLVAGMIEEVFE